MQHSARRDDTAAQPSRMQSAVFLPIGDEGRAELVERRIAEAITGGLIPAGERLPSESALARSLRVAPVTVREALVALRDRGLIVTRRGRNGGSFVADSADPAQFTAKRLGAMSRVALRDLGAHYSAITRACVGLAAARADASEVARIRQRLANADAADEKAWRRAADEAQTEIAALSQSARLTREQMRLQAEFSPFLGLIGQDASAREQQRRAVLAVLDALERGDADAAASAVDAFVRDSVALLIDHQMRLHRA
ncbi:FadR/GntR family transcriptional regulator [Ruicaihuangia caeni]|uniref:GntR family transcriptional regulator n=1 Tax=Ruicaihuangia caeni TaxID=3042517 RepID=A0AAW6T663_9MICO|nr:GntR family transcriptional regulator [Klugiella sp. YN-L-19]MDI2099262.1 GntR family transcriptional regulator [Klugiella sp. YN-L-19]